MQQKPNTKLRDLPTTYKLGKKFTKVVRSNGKNMNHCLMEHLMVCYCHELETNQDVKQQLKMTLADISKAQNMSSRCLDSGYTDC